MHVLFPRRDLRTPLDKASELYGRARHGLGRHLPDRLGQLRPALGYLTFFGAYAGVAKLLIDGIQGQASACRGRHRFNMWRRRGRTIAEIRLDFLLRARVEPPVVPRNDEIEILEPAGYLAFDVEAPMHKVNVSAMCQVPLLGEAQDGIIHAGRAVRRRQPADHGHQGSPGSGDCPPRRRLRRAILNKVLLVSESAMTRAPFQLDCG